MMFFFTLRETHIELIGTNHQKNLEWNQYMMIKLEKNTSWMKNKAIIWIYYRWKATTIEIMSCQATLVFFNILNSLKNQ